MSRSEEIRTTFLMCRMGRIVYASVELFFWTQPLGRVLWLAFVPYLEVQARPLQRAGVPDGADQLPLLDLVALRDPDVGRVGDRKSTRLNSSHDQISYAVFCLKKKK